jgi:hypothetical protein
MVGIWCDAIMAALTRRRVPAEVRLIEAGELERVPQSGAVASVQEAEVSLAPERLEQLWHALSLERLAAAYWRHVRRATLGLVRVAYAPDSRTVVLLSRRLPLLRFRAPEYELGPGFGSVSWRIERGILVSTEGRGTGHLRIYVWRLDDAHASVRVRLEVRNFYPWLRGRGWFARFGTWIYAQTQLRIHVAVCRSFLRSLASLELPLSTGGALQRELTIG